MHFFGRTLAVSASKADDTSTIVHQNVNMRINIVFHKDLGLIRLSVMTARFAAML